MTSVKKADRKLSAALRLRKMTESEFQSYIKSAVPAYALEKQRGENLTPDQAMKVALNSFEKLLPNGLASADQHFFSIVAPADFDGASSSSDDLQVGILWLAKKTAPHLHVWIYDILLHETVRGRGLGRKVMALAEIEARNLGVASIGLHVFGHNKIAQDLYEKVGYRTTNRIMAKDLS